METLKLLENIEVLVFGLVMWVIQLLLLKSANRKFESYKTELNQKTKEFQFLLDSKLQTYRMELKLQNYKETKVYEQQLTIIIDLHKKLTVLHKKMVLISIALKQRISEQTEEYEKKELESVADASITYDDLLLFYQDNLIFIPQNTVDTIDTILQEYSQNFANYIKQRGTINDITFEQALESESKINGEIKEALNLLTCEFKRLIGVEIKA